ncbi:MAG: WG repeat-containing protein [Bacteroidia bacterium]|nr:WG repeat-containing protein [Bacteroidia bacterium]
MAFNKTFVLFIGLSCLLFSPSANAQINKGFDALNEYDFFKARKLFLKSIRKNPVEANYGLARIHYDSLNHFHSIDSANFRLHYAREHFNVLDSVKKKRLLIFGITDSSLTEFQHQICNKAYQKAVSENSLEGFDHFLKYYSCQGLQGEITDIRNESALKKAVSIGTAAALEQFIAQYPDARQLPQARKNLDAALFKEETAGQRIVDFERFLLKYPNSLHAVEAENAIYQLVTPQKNMEELYAFVRRYPTNRNTSTAWDLLYTRFTSDQRKESFTAFKERYPEYPFQERVGRDFALSSIRLFPVVKEQKWGYADSLGKILIPFQFDEAGNFSENLAPVRLNGQINYINKAGLKVISENFDEGYAFQNGLAIVEIDGLSGIINTLGEWVVPPTWPLIEGPFYHLYKIGTDSSIRIFDGQNNAFLPALFHESGNFSEGFCAVGIDGHYGYIDSLGKQHIPLRFQEAQPFHKGLARVMEHGLYGMVNTSGNVVVPFRYEGVANSSEGYIKIYQNGKCAFLDLQGKLKIPFKSNCAVSEGGNDGFIEGLARIQHNGKVGFIDKKGKVVIQAKFNQVMDFSEGLAAFRKGGLWGFIDKAGKIVIPASYQSVMKYSGAYARVGKQSRWGLIDKSGRIVIPLENEEIQLAGTCFILSKNGGKRLYDNNLNPLLAFECDDIRKSAMPLIFELYKNGRFAYFHTVLGTIFWQEEGF